jgi:biotin carboxyl carrier protein
MVFLLFDLKQIIDQIMDKIENNKGLKFLNIDESLYKTNISRKFENRKKYQPVDPKMIKSFIPGTVLNIMVLKGQKVDKGEDMMILDAMKMQNKLKSAIAGRIKKIHVNKGDKVSKGTLLIELE